MSVVSDVTDARVVRAARGSAPQLPAAVDEFELPSALEAREPPEARGSGRDDVRMLVARRGSGALTHHRFGDLPAVLRAGDLLVVNTSATVPAAVDGMLRSRSGDRPVVVHFSTPVPGGLWSIELRRLERSPLVGVSDALAGTSPLLDAPAGARVDLAGSGTIELLAPTHRGAGLGVRLWLAAVELPAPMLEYLARYGRPIRYGYVPRDWGIDAYQTVFAEVAGSAEMPSAARPFTAEIVTRLVSAGVGITPLVLHTGVSSLEAHEPPYAERYDVPEVTAERVNSTRAAGGRVIAVGTTAVRALHTVTDRRGRVHPGSGWTEVVVGPGTTVAAVDGMLTGWHEPRASHLAMLESVAGPEVLRASYDAALAEGYRWHEFGDVHLILP